MPLRRPNRVFSAILTLCLAACGGSTADAPVEANGQGQQAAPAERLGLFSTLPIYWGEGADIGAMLDGGGEPGWVRPALEKQAALVPLDTLEEDALSGLGQVILAQPRPLAPSENVAFDSWLREGGHALILADPMLTQHSDFALGDPRRPHDLVLISPLLKRWGLELRFDEEQPEGERMIAYGKGQVPVELSGHFVVASEEAEAECTVGESGLVATCKIGDGRAVLVADAAMVDDHFDTPERRAALDGLLAEALSN